MCIRKLNKIAELSMIRERYRGGGRSEFSWEACGAGMELEDGFLG